MGVHLDAMPYSEQHLDFAAPIGLGRGLHSDGHEAFLSQVRLRQEFHKYVEPVHL